LEKLEELKKSILIGLRKAFIIQITRIKSLIIKSFSKYLKKISIKKAKNLNFIAESDVISFMKTIKDLKN
jgi:hypothetical protein